MNAEDRPLVILTEESEHRLEVLRRGIKRAAGFTFYVVLAKDLARVELLRKLRAWSGVGGFPELRFFPPAEVGARAVERFLAAMDEEHAPAGAVIPDGAALVDADEGDVLATLNVSRDVLDRVVQGPLLLVLPPEREADLARRAPDLFDVRAGTIAVEGMTEPPPVFLAEVEQDTTLPPRPLAEIRADVARLWRLERVDEPPAGALVDAWVGRGYELLDHGEVGEAQEAAEAAQRLAEAGRYRKGAADAMTVSALALRYAGNLDEAQRKYESALNAMREIGDTQGMAATYRNLAKLAQLRRDLNAAEAYCEESIAIEPSQEGLAASYAQLASIARARGEIDRAREILDGVLALRRPAAPTAPEVSIGRLPVTSPDLFGRDAELAWLDTCWAEGVRVASIVAWGGVGKSALVNAWLRRMDAAGWRGAARVFGWSFYSQGTDRLTSSDEFIDEALRWFGDKDPKVGSPWDKGERLAALVRKQRTILVLDGVEPLQWGPGVEEGKLKDPALQALFKELGAQNTGLCLITSRIHMTDLESLAGDKMQAHRLDHLSAEAGAELLRAHGARGKEEELRAAAKEYDGHSFALTLLGSYVRRAHKGDIRRRDLIPPLGGKPAHRMMAIYERWFENKPELAILRMLGLFDRPVPEDEIAVLRAAPVIRGLTDALARLPKSAWNEAVTALRDVGLLAAGSETEAERLDAHPLVREYFGEQLRRERPRAWKEGHRRLYEHLKHKAKPLPDTIEEMAPLYAAVVHGCLAGKNQEALDTVFWQRIYRGQEKFNWRKLGAFGSEVAVLSAFFDPPWERLAPGLSGADGAGILNNAGFALHALGRLPEATGLMRMALARDIAQKDWKNAAISASNLSELLQSRGELHEAVDQARTSIMLADRSGDAFWRMRSRTTLAAAQHAMGLREEAAAQFEEAERMQKEIEPAYPLLYGLPGFQYCDILLDQGRDADVRERAAQTLEIAERNHWLLRIALDHLSLGRAHLLGAQRGADGDLDQAASHLAASVDGLRHSGQQDELPRGLLARAALHTETRAFALARKDLDEALTLATRCGFRLHEADAHLGHARLCLAEGAPAAGRPHLERARKLIEETGYHRRDGELAELEALFSK